MAGRLTGEKVVGIKQSIKALKNHQGKILYVAKDADETLIQPIIELGNKDSLEVIYIDTMKELGDFCAIDVAAAVAVVLK